MKSNAPSSLLFSASKQLSNTPGQNLSPYLKAILSGKLLAARNESYYNNENSDRAAASRYIRESKNHHKQ